MSDSMVIKWLLWLKNLVPAGSEQDKALNIAIEAIQDREK